MAYKQNRDLFVSRSKIRIRDGGNVFKILLSYLVLIIFSGFLTTLFPPAVIVCLLLVILFPFSLVRQIRGVVIKKNGILLFPGVFRTRKINIDDIDDVNSEFRTQDSLLGTLGSTLSSESVSSMRERIYCVNISGIFGSCQIRFSSKRKRDHFLSVLRQVSPQARITRYT